MKRKLTAFLVAGLLVTTLVTPAMALNVTTIHRNSSTANIISPGRPKPTTPINTISFEYVGSRMRSSNPTILSLKATLDAQLSFDTKKAASQLRSGIGELEFQISILSSLSTTDPVSGALMGAQIASMKSQVKALEDQLDALEDGSYAENMELLTMQIDSGVNQLVFAGEQLYINIIIVQNNLADLNHAIEALDRTLAEMELRYKLGQISALTLEQFKETCRTTKNQAVALESTLGTMKASLENLLGTTVSGTITLSALPAVSSSKLQIATIPYTSALDVSKQNSYTISKLEKDLDDAEETWKKAKKDHGPTKYEYKMAEQTYQAALYTYESGVKNYETSFRTIYLAVSDAQLVLDSAKTSYTFQEKLYAAEETKYNLGQISASALQKAKDDLATSKSAVTSAETSLFSSYNTYHWAYYYGLV